MAGLVVALRLYTTLVTVGPEGSESEPYPACEPGATTAIDRQHLHLHDIGILFPFGWRPPRRMCKSVQIWSVLERNTRVTVRR